MVHFNLDTVQPRLHNTLMPQDSNTIHQSGQDAQEPKSATQMVSARVATDLWSWVLMRGASVYPRIAAQDILRQALVEFRERVEAGQSHIGA